MNKNIVDKIAAEIVSKKISEQEVEDAKKEIGEYISELQKQASISLDLELEKFIIARR
ncbi:MAG: hypothetical protein Q8L10_02340 [Candidatus Moranbacteria bacterium]|nr:hypothetical protein [Candidatus Moranbacteria bacterium]